MVTSDVTLNYRYNKNVNLCTFHDNLFTGNGQVSPVSNNSHRIVASQIGRDLKHDYRIQLFLKAFNLLSTSFPL